LCGSEREGGWPLRLGSAVHAKDVRAEIKKGKSEREKEKECYLLFGELFSI